jgi:hypothetical protein
MARPVWAVLDAAGVRRFTGEITLGIDPVVRVWFQSGEVYLALRDGQPEVPQLLLDYEVVTRSQLQQGMVQLAGVDHLGRLFDRVPLIDRDRVELALEIATAQLLGEIADHVVTDIDIASYRHHPSGVAKWIRRTTPVDQPADVTVATDLPTGVVPVIVKHQPLPSDPFVPTAADEQLVAEYEASMTTAGSPTEAPPSPVEFHLDVDEIVAAVVAEATGQHRITPTLDVVAEVPTAVVPPPTWSDESVFDADGNLRPVEFDLAAVLAEIIAEDTGAVPIVASAADRGEDVDVAKTTVRHVLAEIEAATRPRPVDQLSPAAFAAALDTAPDSPADLEHSLEVPAVDAHGSNEHDDAADDEVPGASPAEPVGAVVSGEMPIIRLPDRPVRPIGPATAAPSVVRQDASGTLPSEPAAAGKGLRRLIGGNRPH